MVSSLYSYGRGLGPPRAVPILSDAQLAAPEGTVYYANLRDVGGRCVPGWPSTRRADVVNGASWTPHPGDRPYARVKITIKRKEGK